MRTVKNWEVNIFLTHKNDGGFSGWKYADFNLWLHVGDDDEKVLKNRSELAKRVWYDLCDFVYLNQVHGDEVVVISDDDKWKWSKSLEDALSADAMITDRRWVVLVVMIADCVPIIFYNEMRKVIWVVHAGWRGSSMHISDKTIQKMIDEYGSRAHDINVIIWPAIWKDNYEVPVDIAEKFDPESWSENHNWKAQLDLQLANKIGLIQCWIRENNITMIREDTFYEKNNYFSARRDGVESGRFVMGIYLN